MRGDHDNCPGEDASSPGLRTGEGPEELELPWAHQPASEKFAVDHRVSDGHLGGQLLAAIDSALQSPDTL